METFFALTKTPKLPRPAATIGVFDGVHRGHLAVIRETIRRARDISGASLVVTFDHHPDKVLTGSSPESITSLEHRLHLISLAGVDDCLVLHFDQRLAETEPEDFVRNVLHDRLAVSSLVLGFNTRIGRKGRGDAALLVSLCKPLGIDSFTVPPLIVDSLPVSSTRIRSLIESGNLAAAADLLGRPFTLRGSVVHGQKRGRRLGFPTANLNLHHEITPPPRVYTCRASLDSGSFWGLVNIGVCPTFQKSPNNAKKSVEVFLQSYHNAPLYGLTLEVEPIHFLRHELCFDSPEDLVRQIEKDVLALDALKAAPHHKSA